MIDDTWLQAVLEVVERLIGAEQTGKLAGSLEWACRPRQG